MIAFPLSKLKDLPISIIDGDRSAKYPKREEFLDSGVPFLSSTNILPSGRFDFQNMNYISEQKFASIKKGRVQGLDVVMTTRGSSVGKVACIPSNFRGLINAQMLILRADNHQFSSKYLFYWLLGSDGQKILKNFSSGSAQPQIPIRDLQEIELPVPSFDIQCRIATILSAYDDLIENNTRRIAVLEEMARRIYEEWFVHFRYPGHEQAQKVETELGLVPKGWSISTIGECCTRIQSGGTPSRKNLDYWSDGTVDWYKTQELKNCFLFDADERICESAVHAKKAKIFPAGTILLAIYGATIGRLGVTTRRASCNQAALGFEPDEQRIKKWFLYSLLSSRYQEFNDKAQGAAQQNMSKERVAATKFVLSPNDIQSKFDVAVAPMFELIRTLQQKNANLRQTRDLLLPRLISGELDVSTLVLPE
ncbi:restriction endonuclease subunit S [uncultured Deefgea sp.]|uniref:restriction endonuclease subunit S n=1 Tax=uncultured Deefgea sp. TaxID=1304914 RepID=UPI00260BD809|nr:restriction endonuclease subunit S [uncultured Deefgea sp.]